MCHHIVDQVLQSPSKGSHDLEYTIVRVLFYDNVLIDRLKRAIASLLGVTPRKRCVLYMS